MGENLSTRCVLAGGGPAGMMAGFLLARSGIDVIVLEKHKDFFRDFRGDTIHPSTMQVMDELGLLDEFLKVPHQQVTFAALEIGGNRYRMADFTHLPTRCKFVALMPQWDFLNFLAAKARAFSSFRLMMETEATDVLRSGGRVTGLRARTADGPVEIRADLVIATDGRHSTLRDAAGYRVREFGVPIDVLWFRLNHEEREEQAVLGRIEAGQLLVMLDRRDYWQCALIIRKDGFDGVKAGGLDAFRARVARIARHGRADEIRSWDDVKLLTVAVNRLERWHEPGLLFIGDAAHAMSPIGGIGINLAIQDAVAAANLIAGPLAAGTLSDRDLARVEARRRFPTRLTQGLQVLVQDRVIGPVLRSDTPPTAPWFAILLQRWPWLQRLPARAIGMGVRPEHVHLRAA